MKAKIRKLTVTVEETLSEMGREIMPPTRKAVAVAVIENPFAGRYVEDLGELMEIGAELGGLLGERCVLALDITPEDAESYGKSAMVGENGELEHAAAILHPKLGAPLRKAVERAPHWCRPPRRWAAPAKCSTCLWATRMRPMCAAISTASRCA